MAETTVIQHTESELAEFVVDGTVSADEIIAIAQNNPSFAMRRHLVDMTKTGFHLLDNTCLFKIAEAFKELEQGRVHGRTAVLVSSDADAKIPKLFAAISEGKVGRKEAFKITSSRDKALSWLFDNDR